MDPPCPGLNAAAVVDENSLVGAVNDVAKTGIHSNVGPVNENQALDHFKRMLPPALQARSGLIIDSHGNKTDQMDIIILQYCACHGAKMENLFPIESVVAAISVKSTLAPSSHRSSISQLQKVLLLRPEADFRPLLVELTYPLPELLVVDPKAKKTTTSKMPTFMPGIDIVSVFGYGTYWSPFVDACLREILLPAGSEPVDLVNFIPKSSITPWYLLSLLVTA